MPDYTTHYIFDLEINGAKAVEQAKSLRAQIAQELQGEEPIGAGMKQAVQGVTDLDAALKGHITTLDTYQKAVDAAQKATGNWGQYVQQGVNSLTQMGQAYMSLNAAMQTAATQQQAPAQQVVQAVQQEAQAVGGSFQQMATAAQQSAAQVVGAQSTVQQAMQKAAQAATGGVVAQPGVAGVGQAIQTQIAQAQAAATASLVGGRGGGFGVGPTQQKNLLQSFTEGVNEATVNIWGLRRAAYGLESAGRALTRFSSAQIQNIREAVEAYGAYSDAITRAQMAMEMPKELFNALSEAVLKTSVDLARFKPEELAEGLRIWAAGTGAVIQNQGDLNKLLEQTVDIQKLAAMNNVSLAQTTDTVGGIMHEYALDLKDVSMISEVLNFVAANTFANVSDMGSAFRMVGPLADSMGVSFTETAAAIGLLSNANLKGTMVGRAIRQMFLQMLKPSDDYNKVMNVTLGLTEDMGDAWKTMIFPQGQFVGMANYVDLLAEKTENLTEQQRNETLAVLSTANELPTLVTLVKEQIEARKYGVNILRAYQKAIMGVNDAEVQNFRTMYEQLTGLPFTIEGAAARFSGMWEQFVQSPKFALDQIQRRWDAAMIRLGQAFRDSLLPLLEQLTGYLEWFATWARANPFFAEQAIQTLKWAFAIGTVLSTLGFLFKTGTNFYVLAKGIGAVTTAIDALLAAQGLLAGGKVIAGGAAAAAGAATTTTGAAVTYTGAGAAAGGAAAGGLLGPALGILAAGWTVVTGALGGALGRSEKKEQEVARLVRDIYMTADSYEELTAKALKLAEAHGVIDQRYKQAGKSLEWLIITGILPAKDAWETYRKAVEAGEKVGPSGDVGMWKLKQNTSYMEEMQRMFKQPEVPEPTGLQKMLADFNAANEKLSDLMGKRNNILTDYWQNYQDTQKKGQEQALNAEQEFARRMADMAFDYEQSRVRSIQDYATDEARTIEDHKRDMARDEEDFNRQEAERVDDHNKDLERLEREHQNRLIDLLEARDVQGIVKEMRDYKDRRDDMAGSTQDVADRRADFERQQAQKETDFQLQLARKREDFNLELARRADDYALQIQQALQDYERQVDERKIQLATELADLAVKRDEALAKLTQVTQPLTVAGAMDPMYYEEALKGGLQGVADAADDVIAKESEILAKFFEMAQPMTKQVTIQLIYESLNPELAQPEAAPRLPLIMQGAGGRTMPPETGPMLGGGGGGAPRATGPMLGGGYGGAPRETGPMLGGRLAQPILGQAGAGGLNVSLLQQNVYNGMGAGDQEWYRQVAYAEAQQAIQEAVRSYRR